MFRVSFSEFMIIGFAPLAAPDWQEPVFRVEGLGFRFRVEGLGLGKATVLRV
jgi:hypothetical protein